MTKAQYTVHEIEMPSTNSTVPGQKIAKQKLKTYSLDLRIHSPVSLGYFGMEGLDAYPALVRLAKTKGLDVIAVTDFYRSATIDKVKEAAAGSGMLVIPGVDIRAATPECNDIQITCLFPEQAGSQQVAEFLEKLEVPAAAEGRRDFIVAKDLRDILATLEALGGGCFPSRMDKTPTRMGAIPRLVDEYGLRAFDLAYTESARFFQARWPKEKFNLFSFSNANALAQVGSRSARVKLDKPSFEALLQLVKRKAV